MAMTTQIDELTGAGPTSTAVSSGTMNREDTVSGTTPIPVPSATGTNFSWIKTYIMEITATGGLTMTNIRVGKVAAEATAGTKLWHVTSHAIGSYVQAAASPTPTGDNNITPPTLNGAASSEIQPITTPPSVYAAGPFASTGQKGNLVEVSCGVDATCLITGVAVPLATLRWTWTEA